MSLLGPDISLEGDRLWVGRQPLVRSRRLRFEPDGVIAVDRRHRERRCRWEDRATPGTAAGWDVFTWERAGWQHGWDLHISWAGEGLRGIRPVRVRMFHLPVAPALVELLARRPDLRSRLADERRMAELVAEVTSWSFRPLPPSEPLSLGRALAAHQATIAVLDDLLDRIAGRPVAGTPMPDPATVATTVALRLRVVPDDLEAIVRRHLTVPPWPFKALVDR